MDPFTKSPAQDAGAITLRPETAADLAVLFALYAGTRKQELDLTGWDQATRQTFLQMQFHAQGIGYRQSFPRAEFSMILWSQTPVGRVVINRAESEMLIVDLVLLPEFQNRGLGTRLMKTWLQEASQANRAVRLHVLRGCRSGRFYERLGFRQIEALPFHDYLEWRPPR